MSKKNKRIVYIVVGIALILFGKFAYDSLEDYCPRCKKPGAFTVERVYAQVPDVGKEACAWRQPNGQRCDESIQYCAEGCPPRRGIPNNDMDEPVKPEEPDETIEEPVVQANPLAKRFAELDERAIPLIPKGIVDFDGNALAPQDVLRAGIDESIPSATFNFTFGNIKKGEVLNAVFSGGLPEALPLQSIIFTPDEDIDDGSLTVTIVDGSKPELLGSGAPGMPDYARPEVLSLPKQYALKDYIRVDAKIDRKGFDEYVWDGYEAAPISEVLFKMVTSLVPKKEGFAHPETEVVLLHLNKDNRWDPLVTEKGTECLFDQNLCTFTALSPGFSVFAIAYKKPTNIVPWILFVMAWVPLLIVFYRKFWKSAKEKGFWKFVLIRGFFIANVMAVFTTSINIVRQKITLAKFADIYSADIVVGLIIGIILWFITKRKGKEVS